MFTVTQIEEAHSKVKSGADFPKYIQEIKSFGVLGFTTWVKDSHTDYICAVSYTHLDVYKRQFLGFIFPLQNSAKQRNPLNRRFRKGKQPDTKVQQACLLYTSRCV